MSKKDEILTVNIKNISLAAEIRVVFLFPGPDVITIGAGVTESKTFNLLDRHIEMQFIPPEDHTNKGFFTDFYSDYTLIKTANAWTLILDGRRTGPVKPTETTNVEVGVRE
jgi:hypothetical protein